MRTILTNVWAWLALVLIVIIVLTAVLLAGETVQPYDLSVTRMGVTEARIRQYWNAHTTLPARLSDLPPVTGRDTSTLDGWGTPLKYDTTGPTTVKLTSFGQDRTLGSTDDIVSEFDASR
jgi:hypothetical protein